MLTSCSPSIRHFFLMLFVPFSQGLAPLIDLFKRTYYKVPDISGQFFRDDRIPIIRYKIVALRFPPRPHGGFAFGFIQGNGDTAVRAIRRQDRET